MPDNGYSPVRLQGAARIMAVLADEDQGDGLERVFRTREDYLRDVLHAVAAEAVAAAVDADSGTGADAGEEAWQLLERWSQDSAAHLAVILRTI